MMDDEVIYLGSDAGVVVPEIMSGVSVEYRAYPGTDAYDYISNVFGSPDDEEGVRYIRIVWRGQVEFSTFAKDYRFYENGMLVYTADNNAYRLVVHLSKDEIRDLVDHIEYTYQITEY